MSETVSPERLTALRHMIYFDLFCLLPIASFQQTQTFIANLALTRGRVHIGMPTLDRQKVLREIYTRLVLLRVSPDLTEAKLPALRNLEDFFAMKYGDRLDGVAGFYRDDPNRWRLNMPERCALMIYKDRYDHAAGFLCQPLHQTDRFFLLSSRGQAGYSAERLTATDRKFFERFTESTPTLADAGESADLAGYRWTGRRFVERKTEAEL